MSKSLAIKWIVIIVVLLGSLALIYPNYSWYSKPSAERAKLEAMGDRPERMLNLGLDLRGGSSLHCSCLCCSRFSFCQKSHFLLLPLTRLGNHLVQVNNF